MKRARRKWTKVVITTPFSRAVTSYESVSAARRAARDFREKKRSNPTLWRGTYVHLEAE